jgi:uncharacterized protein
MSFWKTKTLSELSNIEWESLCDGCAKCCLHKLEDEDTGDIYFTSIACRLLDLTNCRCTRYAERTELIPDCLDLKKLATNQYHWLPATCAYRLRHQGKDLPDWHPLISNNTHTIKAAGISVDNYARTESSDLDLEDLEDFILEWLE